MGHYSTTGAPAWAILTWMDDNFVYTQIPSKDGSAPFIQKYELSDGGLGRALADLREIYRKLRPPGNGHTFSYEGRKPRPAPTLGTASQRENARQVLKRLKII